MGVWIETCEKYVLRLGRLVTPHVGVWIETEALATPLLDNNVTPHVGVWIETAPNKLKPANP